MLYLHWPPSLFFLSFESCLESIIVKTCYALIADRMCSQVATYLALYLSCSIRITFSPSFFLAFLCLEFLVKSFLRNSHEFMSQRKWKWENPVCQYLMGAFHLFTLNFYWSYGKGFLLDSLLRPYQGRLWTNVEKIYVHKVVHQLVKSFPVSWAICFRFYALLDRIFQELLGRAFSLWRFPWDLNLPLWEQIATRLFTTTTKRM